MKPKIKRTIVIILISIALTIGSLLLHFRVIVAADLTTIQPKNQAVAIRIYGTLEVKETKGTICLNVMDQHYFAVCQFPSFRKKYYANIKKFPAKSFGKTLEKLFPAEAAIQKRIT